MLINKREMFMNSNKSFLKYAAMDIFCICFLFMGVAVNAKSIANVYRSADSGPGTLA
jgi:hypothetical protein